MATGDCTTAITLQERALELASARQDAEMVAAAETAIGEIRMQRGEYPAALEHLLRAEALCEESGNEIGLGTTCHIIAQVHRNLGRADLELHYLHRMLACVEQTGRLVGIGIATGEIGMYHYGRGELAGALGYLNRARDYFEEAGNGHYLCYAELFLAMVYNDMKEYGRSIPHYCSALTYFAALGDRIGRSNVLVGMAEARSAIGEWGAALEHAREALAIGEEIDSPAVRCRAYQVLAEIHEATGSFREAVECYHLFMRLKEDLGGAPTVNAVARLQARAEVEAAERERRAYAEKIERLEREMERQARELASMALHLTQKGKVVARLKEEVLPLARNGGADRSELARMLQRQIESDGVGESEWRSFDRQFGRMQEGFLQALARHSPNLTRSELRLCLLLRQELASKEIANMLNISLTTVQTHRRRIRKKLGLAADAGLTQFLLALG
jgi:DNA-binding CsgD family transcriptional regulator/tetratricopeptide (TPR) repeat protein